MPKQPSEEELISRAKTEIQRTDSEGLPPSVASRLVYCVPLASNVILEGDTMDGGEYRIPIELEFTSAAIVTLIPDRNLGTLTILVQSSTFTTPDS